MALVPRSHSGVWGATATGFRAIMFTDCEGTTQLVEALGDQQSYELLHEHLRRARDAVTRNGGTVLKNLGDGLMASFESVADAVDAAIAIKRTSGVLVHPHGENQIRVAVHAGEPITLDGDLWGSSVHVAARASALGPSGDIVVTDIAKALTAGKGYEFQDQGEFDLLQTGTKYRLWSVRW